MLHTTALVAVVILGARVAYAEPTGGNVTSGAATISNAGPVTTINQSSNRAIIRWDSFDLDSSQHVQFIQPDSSSITVNRIRDVRASQIDGRISANGNIVLINPNGIVFGGTSVVDVGGLVATTSDLDDDNAFMAGGAVKFTKPGKNDARVINNGGITVRDGGLVGLVAPHVENHGVIQAKLGKAVLASGDIHTIDFAGDGLIKLEISDDVYAQSITNTGTIQADGGSILITAAAARGMVDTLVTNSGTLRADTVTLADGTKKAGEVFVSTEGIDTYLAEHGLNLSIPADIIHEEVETPIFQTRFTNTGTISVSGNKINEMAGKITLLADLINMGDGTIVEASGDVAGGDIRIGGDYQGGNGVPTSDMVFISEHAILNAGARRNGNGGRIIVWSDKNTRFYGHADAGGGVDGGNGGLIEISGKKHLTFAGTIDLIGGINGTLLLDPTNIVISTAADSNVNGATPFAPTADDVASNLSVATLQAALASGNVIVQTRATGAQAGTITVNNAITWSSGNTLTLDAHDSIIVNAAIAAGTGGSVTMIAGNDVTFNANITGTGTFTLRQASDSLTMGIAGGAGTINLSTSDLTRIVDGWSSVVLGRATSTVLTTVNARTWTDNVTLLSGTGGITIAGTQAMGTNTLTLTTANGAVSIGGMTGTTGGLTVSSGGATISVGGAIATTSGTVSFTSGGGAISNSATIGSGALTMTTGGGNITIGAAVTAAGATNLNAGAGTLAVNAALSSGANALTLTTAGSNITSNASGAITGGVLNITTSGGALNTLGTITASNTTTINTGTGLLTLGATLNAGTNTVGLTTTARNITTAAITAGALTITSNGANIQTGGITGSGNATLNAGNGTIQIGATNIGANALSLTTTGFGITTAAVTSGALTLTSGGGIITTNGVVAANGTTQVLSGGGAVNMNAAFGSGTGALTITTGGGTLTTGAGALSSAAFTINTGAGNVVIGGNLTGNGNGSITTTTGTIGITGTTTTGAGTLGMTTTARTITTAAISSGALTLSSGGANIQTGALTLTGNSTINAGAATINIGAVAAAANSLALTTANFGITTAAVTAGAFTVTSGGGIITLNGNITTSGTTQYLSGGGAVNANAQLSSGAGAMTITTGGGTFTKANTGAMASAALTITTTNGNISIGTGGLTTTGATTMNAGTGSIAVGGTWTATNQTIALTTNNNTITKNNTTSAALTVNSAGGNVSFNGTTTTTGILTINSGVGDVSLAGAVNTAANAINITTTGGDISKTANVVSTGAITWNSGGGAINLGTGSFGAATGSTNLNSAGGNITIGGAGIVYTTGGNVTLNSGATGVITIGGTSGLLTGTGALAITTDTDIVINSAVTGTGTYTFSQFSAATTLGIGAGQTGTINISAAEYALIGTTWNGQTYGRVDGTGVINVGAVTWQDSLLLRSSTGNINLNGAQTFGNNNFTITTDADVTVAALVSGGTGALTIQANNNATSIGLGTGMTGTIAFTDAEVAFLHSNWNNVIFGNTNMTGDINVKTGTTWTDPMSFRTNTGIINFAGTVAMGGNALTFTTNADFNIGGNLTGTGTLTISTVASSTAIMGMGDGQTGALHLSNLEMSRIVAGWGSLVFGSNSANGAINIGARTWDDAVTIQSNTGVISVNGALTMTNNNNLVINTGANLVLGANVAGGGTGALTINGITTATTFGIGDGEAGTVNLTNAELDFIADGWASINFGANNTTGLMNIGNYAWKDALNLRSQTGIINIDGATMGANALYIQTDANLAINGNISGTSTLTIRQTNTNVTMGLNDTGTVNLTTAELGFIQSGFSSVTFGHNTLAVTTGNINVGAVTLNNVTNFISGAGVISINGALNMGTNNLNFSTLGDLAFNAGLAGTGTLTIQANNNATIMGIGTGQAGAIQLSNSDLGNILNGWNSIIFGNTATTTAINVGAYTWQYDTTFRTNTGIINILGAQTTNRNLIYETNANIAIGAALTGTGTLTFRAATAATTIGIAGGAGTIVIDATELGRITDGWDLVVFGSTTGTGAITVNAVTTWTDDIEIIAGSGAVTFATGTHNFNGNDLTVTVNSNPTITGTLQSAGGDLTFRGSSAATTISVSSTAGTLQLINTELNQITDGWATQTYGSVTGTGLVTVGAYVWKDNTTFLNSGNIAVVGAQGSNAGTDVVYASLNGNFSNTAGATVFNTIGAGGRYLIYSTAAGSDSYGGFTPPTAINAQTYFSQAPSTIGAGLNRIIYNTGAAKILYLQIDDKTKIYGDTLPTFTYTYLGGLVGGDTLGTAITSATLSATGASVTDNVGTLTAITGMFSTALGYTVSATNGTLSVTKAPILVTATNQTKAYGDATPAPIVTYIGLRNGDTDAVIDTLATATSGTDEFTVVGTYGISVSGAIDNNYTFNYSPGTLTVNKAVLTATTQDATREFGLTNPAMTIIYTGFKNGEDETVINTGATASSAAVATTGIGTYAITGTGGLDDNYSFSFANTGLLTITRATLTGTTTNNTREYGLANPSLTGNITYTGFRNADTAAVVTTAATVSTTAVIGSDVGDYQISATGANAANYQFTYVNDGILSVTKANLTATTQNATREYGLANPALTFGYTGFRNGDDALDLDTGPTASSVATVLSNVGTYAITGAGGVDNNYNFIYADTGILTVSKATLTATTQNATREYGLANPALSVVYTGFRNGDDELDLTTLATATTSATLVSPVAAYAISSSGAFDDNYQFTYANTGLLDVTKATINVTTQNATREYGVINPSLSLNYTGFRNGEDSSVFTTQATAGTAATILTDVGDYAVTGSGGVATNYQFNYINTGLLSITKAQLTATSQNATREYGLANPTFTFIYTGFRNGDDALDLDTSATGASTATITSDTGTYGITGSGALDNNYSFTYADTGILTITKAMLTATTQNATREYGVANPTLSVVYTGFRNGDDDGDINALATPATVANLLSNVGSYAITASGALDNNYDFTYANTGNLSVTKATLTATTQNATRQYGLANPALSVVYTGFRNGDDDGDLTTLATAVTAATILSNVGTYDITSSGAFDDNYQFTYADTGDLTITKAMLTATTQNATRQYGLANPAFSVVYTGFRNGDDDGDLTTLATAVTAATILSNVGTYDITSSGAVDDNYDFTYADTGDLTITKAMLTATTQNATREYGLANPTLNVVYTGFRNGDDDADLTTLANATTAATILSNVGAYDINATGAADDNYDFTYANTGDLTITKAMLTATTQNATRQYGLANPAFSVVYTGFRNGDDSTDLTTLATASTLATILSNVGTYDITSTGAADDNYDFTYADTGDLTITKAMLTATTQNATREYGLANPTFSVVYTGYRNGDDDTDLTTLANATTAATILSNVGAYDITSSGAADDNYDFTYANTGDLTITKATLTATTQNATRQYGLANPAFSVVYTGFRNGDDDTDIGTLANITTAATIFSNVGVYDINASGAVDNNYQFTYANTGDLTITKAMLTATTQNATREYGLNNPTLSVVYTGFRNADDSTDIDTLANRTTAATILSNVGTYGINASGAVDNNYDFTYVNTGNLNITKATLTVTADDKQREITEPDPTFTATYTGFRNGDDELDVDTLASMTTNATGASPLGSYDITPASALDNNYQFAYVNGTLFIVPDSSAPIPTPTPDPIANDDIPSTVEQSLNDPFANFDRFYEDWEDPFYFKREGIIYIDDDAIWDEDDKDFLIAITESLRRQYAGARSLATH